MEGVRASRPGGPSHNHCLALCRHDEIPDNAIRISGMTRLEAHFRDDEIGGAFPG